MKTHMSLMVSPPTGRGVHVVLGMTGHPNWLTIVAKKRRTQTRLMLTSGSACAFPQLQTLSSTGSYTIIRHTMSIRLVEGG
jgi:hypothetical protein